jgi:uncharacterized membrane protein
MTEREEGMRVDVQVRVRDKDPMAVTLGWFSIGLGTAQATAPKLLCRLVGASTEGHAPALMRLRGLGELTQGTAILARPRPTGWVWSRVAGDAIDLALLGLVGAKNRRARTTLAIANVAAVTVADVAESRFLSRRQGPVRAGMLVRKGVTINRSKDDVAEAWASAGDLPEKVEQAGGSVRFADAPGGRGTELVVELWYEPPAGDLGAAALKLTGGDLPTQLADDLRRFKQLVETGEVVRSDGTPDGHLLADHLRQRAARPLEEAVR